MRRIAYIIAVAAAVILAAVVVIRLVSGTEDRWEAEDTYTEAVESFTSVPIDTAPSLPPAPFQDEAKEAQAAHSYEVPIQVDFEEIRKTAPDVVGWIFCEGTAINYPIVRGDDDSFYLTHNYKGDHSSAGSIMMGTTCAADFSDRNILLYGHNMANGSMFSDLKKWGSQSFADEHPVIWIITPKRAYAAEVFAGYKTEEFSDVYTVYLTSSPSFEKYLARAESSSIISMDVEIDPNAKYVVLSTCYWATGSERWVLHAKLTPVG